MAQISISLHVWALARPDPARGLLLAYFRLVRPGFKDNCTVRDVKTKLGQVSANAKNVVKSLASARLLQVLKPEQNSYKC